MLIAPKLSTESIHVRKQSIAREFESSNGTVGRIAMSETTGIFDHHRDVTKISPVANRRFNTDFKGDADDGKGHDAAIAQRHIQWRAFERRHADLVEDGFARRWIHLRNKMESRASRNNQGSTCSGAFPRCQAIAMRN